jgi:hypothetical protein
MTFGGHLELFNPSCGGGEDMYMGWWGPDRLWYSMGTAPAKTSMCLILQMFLVQYGISFRFIFALGLTHFLFRIFFKLLFMVLR